MKKQLLLYLILSLLIACSPEAKPIEFGADKCEFCRMTIVDNRHAAELVTDKGKVYKFDAIECQVDYLQQKREMKFALYLVNDYAAVDGRLVDATQCTYLVSPNISSPMGGFLSAFANVEVAQQFQQEHTGDLYTWTELKQAR